jgi:hypothetical protein
MAIRRRSDGSLIFKDHPEFRPNLTPREVILMGSFGGGYWRKIYSSVTKKWYENEHLKFGNLFKGIPDDLLTNEVYDKNKNKYKVSCGSSLEDWESHGWIKEPDVYGWFQFYCNFYLGRRLGSEDDRQIKRWIGINNRFKKRLINMIKAKKTTYDDYSVSPVIRQVLLSWAIELTKNDMK